MSIRIQCLCIDTTDPAGLASFWEAALGWRRTYDKDEQVALEPPEGSREEGIAPDLLFLRVPEDKAGKNRLHLDLRPEDQAAEVARLEATSVRAGRQLGRDGRSGRKRVLRAACADRGRAGGVRVKSLTLIRSPTRWQSGSAARSLTARI